MERKNIMYIINIKYIIFIFICILNLLFKIINNKFYFKGAAICMIAKNENNYIREFLLHYKDIGFKKIYLYDNNDLNKEDFNDVLKDYINSKFVQIINARGKSVFQIPAYNDCYQKNLYDYSWILFVDVDEFLYIKKNKTLIEFLKDNKFKKCQNILINYKEFGDSDLLFYDKRPLSERFIKNYRYCKSMKSFVKGGIKNAKMNIHRSYNIKNYCNSEGQRIEPGNYYTPNISVDSAEIKHYITKTIDEFYKRLIKGWPNTKVGTESYYKFVDNRIQYFFSLNKITKIKFDKIYHLIKDKNLLNYLIQQLNKTL